MSPRKVQAPPPPRVRAIANRLATRLGQEIRAARTRRRWSLADLAARAGVSPSMIHGIEAGEPATLEGYARIAVAFEFEPEFTFTARRSTGVPQDVDPVHAAMGELEAQQFGGYAYPVRLDEPYQHYQFAGRADLVAFAPERGALIHIENRTRFPDVQAFAGSFNAKRQYLAAELAPRFGVRRFASVTHVVVALWSAEVLHSVRLRSSTFRAVAPDPSDAFAGWWSGDPPIRGEQTTMMILDPLPGERRSRRRWIGLDGVPKAEPRYRGYAEAFEALRRAGRA